MNIKTIAAWLPVGVALLGLWGESRYHDGYRAAETKAEKQRNEAAEQMRGTQYRASQTYQAAKAEREAAERIRDETLKELAKSADYRHLCFDGGRLQQFNDTAIGKD